MHTCTHPHVHTERCVSSHACTHTRTQAHTHAHTPHTHTIHTHIYTTHTHTTHRHTHTRTQACMHARIHACTHARTHACTHDRHTHTHTHTTTTTIHSSFVRSSEMYHKSFHFLKDFSRRDGLTDHLRTLVMAVNQSQPGVKQPPLPDKCCSFQL